MAQFPTLASTITWFKKNIIEHKKTISGLKSVEALPFVYEFTDALQGFPTFAVIGCQGENGPEKEHIATLINRQPLAPTAVISLGDTIYPKGASRADHWKFDRYFHDTYSKPRSPLAKINFLMLLGNHDLGIQNKIMTFWEKFKEVLAERDVSPYDRMMAQIGHTYLPPQFSQNWVMPYQFYALRLAQANLFFLNSNFLAFDFVQQQPWLRETYRALNPERTTKWNLVFMHHPIDSPGKRYKGSGYKDIDNYLLPDLPPIKKITNSLTEELHDFFQVLKSEGIIFEACFGAHDHFMAATIKDELHVVSGAAGPRAILQEVKIPVTAPNFASSQNGFVNLSIFNESTMLVQFINLLGQVIHTINIQKDSKGVAHYRSST